MRDTMISARAIYPVMAASGFAGLGYEMVWTRMLSVSLGHEIVAVLAVLSAFFVGLAIGAWALNGMLRRSLRPHRWYAVLELVIGLWALVLVWLVPTFNDVVPRWMGEQPSQVGHWSIAFGATLALLLPATAAMGATLPAIERAFRHPHRAGRTVPGLYAANTFGAVAGTMGGTFVLLPALGYTPTLSICALVNFSCAGAVLWLYRGRTAHLADQGSPAHDATAARPPEGTPGEARLLAMLFATGLLGLGYEVLVVRVLSQVLEDTVFTFAAVLAVYLLGTACGAALYQRRSGSADSAGLLEGLLVATTGAALAGAAALWLADSTYAGIGAAFGHTTASALAGDAALAMMVFFLPTLAMGALFSHLAQRAVTVMGLGRAVGANTLGGAVAPLLAGVLLLPAAGAKVAILLVSVGYLGVLLLVPRPRRLGIAAVPAVAGACLMLMPPLRFVEAPADGQLVDYREGVMAAVAVITDGAGDRHLKVDNHFTMGSTSSGFADHRQTHIPLLLHPQPQRALFLGVGTGMTMNAAQYHAGLEVTAVELVPEVLAMLKHFGTDPAQNHWSPEPRLLASDARRFVLASPERFDVIIADLFHPSRNGAGSLYTREHFDAVRRRLAPGGLFCQWLPLFQMDLETLQVITRTFADRFPYVQVHVPHFSLTQPVVGLIGSEVPFEYGPGWLQNRVRSVDLQQQLVALRLNSDFALFGGYLAGRRGLAHFAGDGALNTDNRPLVTYRAPVFAYRQQQGHGERLVALVEALRSQPGTLLARADSAGQAVFRDRMEAYWQARDAYLRAGLGVDPSDDLEGMLHQVREPLLEVVRISADFTPSYLPLLGMAESLYQVNPAAARDLLVDLDQAGPSRPEARALLRQLFSRRQEESH